MTRLPAVLLTLVAATAAPAAAGPPPHNHVVGGCEWQAVSVADGPYDGEVHAAAVAYALWHQHDPVTMTSLRCELSVNGTVVASFAAQTAGPAGVLAPARLTFTAADSDDVRFCTTAHLVDAHGQPDTYVDCGQTMELRLVPHPVDEVLDEAMSHVVDPPVCAALQTLGPSLPPPLSAGPDGDLSVAGEPWWDCPPYGAR